MGEKKVNKIKSNSTIRDSVNTILELNNSIIFKGENSIYNSKIDTTALFSSWAYNLSDPSASFNISKESFYAVDFDGIGIRNYVLKNRIIKISDKNYTDEGEITKLSNDSLIIKWKATQITMKYVKWIDN